jgi:GNAT superfamily N-acetyltransferase
MVRLSGSEHRVENQMKPQLSLRAMTAADISFADQIRALAGWNQTLADWRRFLDTEPEGCFVAECNGQRAGTATTTVYGPELAWIGMVLVHPEHRQQGIGTALLEQCIQYARSQGVRSIKLDATPAGKKVYDHLGFQDEWTISRWVSGEFCPTPVRSDPRIRVWRQHEVGGIIELDRVAFGIARHKILPALAAQSRHALVFESEPGRIEAYGMMRDGTRAVYLGPVAAATSELGMSLIEALLARCPGEPIYWDIPDGNSSATDWAKQAGFTVQRSLTRMVLGQNATPGDPGKQIALAGPELG